MEVLLGQLSVSRLLGFVSERLPVGSQVVVDGHLDGVAPVCEDCRA